MRKSTKKPFELLPELHDKKIFQPNRVTNAHYDYTHLQKKVFVWVMYHMQVHIIEVMNGSNVKQLPLFSLESDMIFLQLPMNLIAAPNQYGQVRECIEQMISAKVYLRNENKGELVVTTLFSALMVQESGKRSKFIRLQMRKDVARMLCHIDTKIDQRTGKQIPIQYTSYLLRVAVMSTNKYTARIYEMLCSWRERGGWRVPLQELRDRLQLQESNYKNWNDFKRFILDPVALELKANADIWFNAGADDLAERDGKKVTHINFKIIIAANREWNQKRVSHIFWLLKSQFDCQPHECEKIRTIFTPEVSADEVINKIEKVAAWCEKNGTAVKSRSALVIQSLLNEFTPDMPAEDSKLKR